MVNELGRGTAKDVVIFGVGDFARVAYVYLSRDSPHHVVAFTADAERISQPRLMGLEVTPFERLEDRFAPDQYALLVAVGFSRVNRARAEAYERCKARGYELISYVNSKVISWGEVEIGDNCFILENNVIQPFVSIGNDVVIWSGNHIGHDSTIGDHCFIASHAVISGNVQIGERCFLGVNATVRDGISVAPGCVIGAGALILKDTQEEAVYLGQQAKLAPMRSSDLRGF